MSSKPPLKRGFVRIIGGTFRRSHIPVLDLDTLRPTPDRVRETLFNWLQPVIQNACCLDLFAGSGVLGFEALSRGSKTVTFVDQSQKVTAMLELTAKKLQVTDKITILTARAEEALPRLTHPFDIIFLDPPYRDYTHLLQTCHALKTSRLLAQNAYIYLETGARITEDLLPAGFSMLKEKKAGQVFYYLLRSA